MKTESSGTGAQHHPDEWAMEPVLLDGPVERGAFPPVMMAVAALIFAFLLFQLVVSPIAIMLLLLAQGVSPMTALANFDLLLEEHARTLLTANTIGQILGLAVPAFVFARLSSSRVNSFLRLRRVDLDMTLLSVIGLIVLIPFIQWLGVINQQLPVPDLLRDFEQSQMEMIRTILRIDTGLIFNLVVLAVTPAFCEEFLFRGYIQRQAERGMGIAAGIAFSGIIFGLYHLRLTQALPLSALGLYLAYLVWRTGSLWPAIIVHFANNGFAVIVADIVRRRDDIDMDAMDDLVVPWYLALVSVLLFAGVVFVLHQRAKGRLSERQPMPADDADGDRFPGSSPNDIS